MPHSAIVLSIFWLMCSSLGIYIAIQKGRSAAEGALLGLLFGPLGCIVAGLLPTIEPAAYEEVEPATPAAPRHVLTSPWMTLDDAELDDSSESAAMKFLADAEKQAGGVKPIEPVPLDAIAWAAQAEERERRKRGRG